MKKMIINKELLNNYKTFLIGFENCDVYEIGVEDILDVYCEAELIDDKNNVYRTNDGFIKIANRASKTVECLFLENKETGTNWDYRLKERLEMCRGGAVITLFTLRDNKNCDIDVYVPYDPLESIMHGSEIELSNCPSLEIDNDGNMIIAFGEQSKQPKRKDNNYDELIAGWKEMFGDYLPKVLKVKVKSLSTFGDKQTNLSIYFEVCDKNCKIKDAELIFMNCKDILMEMFFPENGSCEIVMSKMLDGCIYVGFEGVGIDFVCSGVLEYSYYCDKY